MNGRYTQDLNASDYEYLQSAGAAVYQTGQALLAGQGNIPVTNTESRKRVAETNADQLGRSVGVEPKKQKTVLKNHGPVVQPQGHVAAPQRVPTPAQIQYALAQFEGLEREFMSWESQLTIRERVQKQSEQNVYQQREQLANWQSQLETRQYQQQQAAEDLKWQQGELSNWQAQLDARERHLQNAQTQLQLIQQDLIRRRALLDAREQQQAQMGFYHQQNVQPVQQQVQVNPEVAVPVHVNEFRSEEVTSTSTEQETQSAEDIINIASEFEFNPLDIWLEEANENSLSTSVSPRVSNPEPMPQEVKETQTSVENNESFWDLNGDFDGDFNAFSQDYNHGSGMTFFSKTATLPNSPQLLSDHHFDFNGENEFDFSFQNGNYR